MFSALAWSRHGEAAEHLACGNLIVLLDRLMRDMGEHSIRAFERDDCQGLEDDRNLRDSRHQPCRRLPQRLAAPETGMRYDVPPRKYPQMQLDIMGQKGIQARAASGDELATSHGTQAQKNRLGVS
ncbi:hypothetical protein GCM10008023_20900 [Sphingomonas glacialis]|uniref:Uncharacterized protein n=1 Tax=Sphingomonas glacialis TaxID=658225 RepID=A0ABQ3LIM4_9SPHN|nr:hypothetical protein [Sphingomonas glacialis]GHH16664.1 hypothetical protein GCM10008023_20900 [Sphingomonas glacialis]